MENLTLPQRNALEAVRAKKCFRVYTATGNIMRAPHGIGAGLLHKLAERGLIADDDAHSGRPGVASHSVRLMLTKRGADALAARPTNVLAAG